MKKPAACFVLFFLLLLSREVHAGEMCVECHGDQKAMRESGYPELTVNEETVRRQTGMPASCTDCHLGDPLSPSKETAHRGLLTVAALDRELKPRRRDTMADSDRKAWSELKPRGDNRASQLAPKRISQERIGQHPEFRFVAWHDKNPETLAFSPRIAEETCGKCHAGIVRGFLKSSMGGAAGAHTQSQYRAWTGKTGPQSCGLWNGRLSSPDQESFLDDDRIYYNRHSTATLSQKIAYDNQRGCNRCHVGCLDCHLDISREKGEGEGNGQHSFARRPASLSCYGGGRGFLCHAGPLERRRGDGYFRAEFTQATEEGIRTLNARPDIHYEKSVSCVDCHVPNSATGFHADLRRDVRCGSCHKKEESDHRKGSHRNVDCASCHTSLIGGYAFNFWSVSGEGGNENPLARFQNYQVGAIPPLLVKNPRGIWIPVHLVPHTSGNVKAAEVKLSKRLIFRNRPDVEVNRRYFSNDSFAVTGLVRALDEKDRDTMVWFNLDRVAHSTGRSRTCEDCHASGSQKIRVPFTGAGYKDVEEGEYTIIADDQGLRVTDFRGPSGGPPAKGLEPFITKWGLKGKFALPAVKDRVRYERMRTEYRDGRFSH